MMKILKKIKASTVFQRSTVVVYRNHDFCTSYKNPDFLIPEMISQTPSQILSFYKAVNTQPHLKTIDLIIDLIHEFHKF